MEIEINHCYRVMQLQGTDLPMSGRIRALKSCIHWCVEYFNIEPSHIEVELRNCGEEFGVYAALNTMDHESKSFFIMINPDLEINDFFLSLCHEMTHAWQVCRGDLMDTGETFYWMNRKVDMSKTAYLDLPWEEEAHRLEDEVFNGWAQFWNANL